MPPTESARPPLILIVDASSDFRRQARSALEGAHLRVAEAMDRDSTLAAIEELEPDLIVLEAALPGDGLALCAEIRDALPDDAIPILLTAPNGDNRLFERGFQVGASDFLRKPLDWLILANRVGTLVIASRAQIELQRSQTSLANAQRIASIGSLEWDYGGDEMNWSAETYRILGIDSPGSAASLSSLLHRVSEEDVEKVRHVLDDSAERREPFSLEFRIVQQLGEVRHVRLQGEVSEAKPAKRTRVHLSGTLQDITEYARAMEQVRYMANFDGLTGLSNRRLFHVQLRETLDQARSTGSKVGLLFMDLDHFKRINDSLGHTAGDLLLQQVSERLMNRVRRSDRVGRSVEISNTAVSRLGGDEFTLLLPGLEDSRDAGIVAQRILREIPPPLEIDGHSVSVTASIGVAVYPDDGLDVETLVKHADSAMYHAKDRGGNNYQFFSQSLNSDNERRLTLESELRNALGRDEFRLHYQPKIHLATGKVAGAEALLRWQHPELGTVSPGEFIPVTEETSLVIPIGDWVLEEACRQVKEWQRAGLAEFPIAVNVSSRQFQNLNLRHSVVNALEMSGLDPRFLELEITESAMMQDGESAAETLRELRELGVHVALDDFGTGYSSLSYVKRFPLDTLKIDRSFVTDLPADPDAAGIVTAIIAMAHVLKLDVVAEGVETEAQRKFLAEHACDQMQGYLESRPLPPEEFAEFLRARSG